MCRAATASGPTLATGIPSRAAPGPAAGFTLIELAVVTLVLAIVLGFTVSRLAGEDRARLLTEAGERFAQSVAIAGEEAVITGRPTGVQARRGGYGLVAWRDGEWRWLAERRLAERKLPEGFALERLGAAPAPAAGGEPEVVLEASGEIAMAELAIVDRASANSILLGLDRDGRVRRTLLSDE